MKQLALGFPQPTRPCAVCPVRRDSLPFRDDDAAADLVAELHSDALVFCASERGNQCAGAAIYRANVCKLPRDRQALRLPVDRDKVFDSSSLLICHHRDWSSDDP